MHVQLDAAELDRLEPAISARPLILDSWAYATGRPLDIMTNRAQVNAKAHEIATRTREAFERSMQLR